LQFSFQAASPETLGYTLVCLSEINDKWYRTRNKEANVSHSTSEELLQEELWKGGLLLKSMKSKIWTLLFAHSKQRAP
jgi:hypothetical protein